MAAKKRFFECFLNRLKLLTAGSLSPGSLGQLLRFKSKMADVVESLLLLLLFIHEAIWPLCFKSLTSREKKGT